MNHAARGSVAGVGRLQTLVQKKIQSQTYIKRCRCVTHHEWIQKLKIGYPADRNSCRNVVQPKPHQIGMTSGGPCYSLNIKCSHLKPNPETEE